MAPIKLEICCGTACYMLGAAKLLTFGETLPPELADKVEVSALPCLDLCMADNLGGAPFVRIDGEVMGQATVERVMEKLLEKVHGGGND